MENKELGATALHAVGARHLGMTIRSYFVDEAYSRVGDVTTVVYARSGWTDLLRFQRDRLAYFKTHPRERADITPHGITVIQHRSSRGLRRVSEITLEVA